MVYSNVGDTNKITPNDEFFTLSIGAVPTIQVSSWNLPINGSVQNPITLTYDEITSMPNITITETLKCVSGPSDTATWTGVPLSYVMNMTDVSDDAVDIVFHAADGYSSSLTIEEASGDDVLLCWQMNGVPLPRNQGYPLKLVVAGHYGYKWVKWITSIEVVDENYRGYWESRGWSDDAQITTSSEWSLHAYLLSIGFIFCGLSVVSGYKVEDKSELWYYLPNYVNMKFHIWSSAIFMILLVITFLYWVYATMEARGEVFYTIHGLFSIFIMITFTVSGISSMFRKKLAYEIHTQAALLGFGLYVLVMFLGLFIAWGSV